MGARCGHASARPGVAELSGRDRAAPHAYEENLTDEKQTPPVVPLRYLLGFIPNVLPIREFFADAIQSEVGMRDLEEAWMKAVLLHVTLWARPYVPQDLW